MLERNPAYPTNIVYVISLLSMPTSAPIIVDAAILLAHSPADRPMYTFEVPKTLCCVLYSGPCPALSPIATLFSDTVSFLSFPAVTTNAPESRIVARRFFPSSTAFPRSGSVPSGKLSYWLSPTVGSAVMSYPMATTSLIVLTDVTTLAPISVARFIRPDPSAPTLGPITTLLLPPPSSPAPYPTTTLESPSPPASYPMNALPLPTTSALPARVPKIEFSPPVVRFVPASAPTTAFESLETFWPALLPIRTLVLPVILVPARAPTQTLKLPAFPENAPTSTFKPPSYLPAVIPMATLLSPAMNSPAVSPIETLKLPMEFPPAEFPMNTLLFPEAPWPADVPMYVTSSPAPNRPALVPMASVLIPALLCPANFPTYTLVCPTAT